MEHTLSKSMQTTLEWIRVNGGTIERFPGGYWGNAKYKYHKTVTVEALVNRGYLEYTAFKDGRNGRFPVCAALRPAPAAVTERGEDGR